jgi:hypothetical protein
MGRGPGLTPRRLLWLILVGVIGWLPIVTRAPREVHGVASVVFIAFLAPPLIRASLFNWPPLAQAALSSAVQVAVAGLGAAITVPSGMRANFVWAAAAVVVLAQIGAVLVESVRDEVIERLSKATRVTLTTYGIRRYFRESLELRSLSYYGLLAGLAAGFVVLAIWRFTIGTGVVLLSCALVGAAIVLLAELVRNAVRMSDPLYDGPAGRLFVRFSARRVPLVRVTAAGFTAEQPTERAQEIACAVADLRKVMFWSSTYGSAVLLGLVLAAARLLLPSVSLLWTAVPALTLLFLCVQLPYVWGQSNLHRNLLAGQEGIGRADLEEKLLKYSPLVPKLPAVAALAATGTVGGIFYVALSKLLETSVLGK